MRRPRHLANHVQVKYGPHLLEVGVEVEKAEGGMKAEALAPHTQGWVR